MEDKELEEKNIEEETLNEEQEINQEIENEEIEIPEFEFDKKNEKQYNLVKLIFKNLKLAKKLKKVQDLKQTYEKNDMEV